MGPVSAATPYSSLFYKNNRSTHNTRIERLWFDFKHGIGRKWREFFNDLESNEGLLVGLPSHIWLLHWLYLDDINDEVQEWAESWNHHRLSLKGEVDRSPFDLFLFSLVQDGVRGVEGVRDESIDPGVYGVDWEVIDDPRFRNHLTEAREEDSASDVNGGIVCEVADCPLPSHLVDELRVRLRDRVNISSRSLTIRRYVWHEALQICYDLQDTNGLDGYVIIISI